MEDVYEKIIKVKDKPLFKEKISVDNHKIFYKYTSHKYYKYIYDLLDTLCKKCPYENKSSIFHMSLYFILKILYKCRNNPYLTNLDLIVFNCFTLGIKSIIKQIDFPSISRIKKIYEEKYKNYKNEEIYKGEIICIKLLNYKINVLTAYEYILYLTKNDLKLKELSLINLDFLIVNNLKQIIYKSSFDIAIECIKNIQNKIMNKEPTIIKKKIINPNGFNCSPKIKKYLSSDKLVNTSSNSPKFIRMNNNEIKIKNINNINKSKNFFVNKKTNIMMSNLNLKNSADKIYYKKNCNDNHLRPNTNLITEANINNDNNKKLLFYNKINKIAKNKFMYKTKNQRNYDKKKSTDISRKKMYLYNNKIKYKRNKNVLNDNNININLNINNTQYVKRSNLNNLNITKENDSNFLNLYERKDSDIYNLNFNRYSPKDQDLKDYSFDSFVKGIKFGIETKNINLGSLKKCNNNNSNYQRYNMSIRKDEKHQKLISSNIFNITDCSQVGIYNTNKNLGKYYIHW